MRLEYVFLILAAYPVFGQQPGGPPMEQILARLDRLESDNQRLQREIGELRQEVARNAPAATGERLDVLEHRSEEADQVKVQAAQRYPLTLSGIALFNLYSNGKDSGAAQDPLVASLISGRGNSGASVRQSTIGLRFEGPQTIAGAKVSGALDFDLWGGDSTSLNHLIRLRTATVRLDWDRTSVSVGQDKPLIAPRDPDSLAQVAFSPLTAAGNPWLWQPQARVEQRFAIGETSGVVLQGSLYQTRETYPNLPPQYQDAVGRPGWEGRVEYWRQWGDRQRLEIAPGFHASITHSDGQSLTSGALSFDWLVDPLPRWEITGAFYRGQNLTNIGNGGPGLSLLSSGSLVPVHQTAGWLQSSWKITSRLKWNAFAGEQSNRPEDLSAAAIRANLAWGGNFMFRLAPNVMTSFEALQVRTNYFGSGTRLNNHYDLALAYFF